MFLKVTSGIKRVIVFGFLFAAFFNGECGSERELRREDILLLTLLSGDRTQLRNLWEPNDDFSSARCMYDHFDSLLYPKNDLDFYKIRLASGSLKLNIYEYETLAADYNLGIQIYDDNQVLLYDLNDKIFESVSSILIENRNMSYQECVIDLCHRLDRYRYIEFSPNNSKFYIKFYVLDQSKYNQDRAIESVSVDKLRNPTNQSRSFTIRMQGDFQTCL